MSDPYVGEIRLVAFNFAPVGWAFCDGSAFTAGQNGSLAGLIGYTFGGANTTFRLPDLRGRAPVHMNDASFPIAASGGSESATLTLGQIPAHDHGSALCSGAAATATTPAAGATWAVTARGALYLNTPPSAVMANTAIATAGANQPHENRQPSLAMNYIIALQGIYPSSN